MGSNLATGFSFRLEDDSPLTMGLGVFGLARWRRELRRQRDHARS